jgi:hypothetical protein
MISNAKRATALAPLLAAALLVVGCGGSGDSASADSETNSSASTTRDPETQAAFTECLAENGVEVPEGESLSPGERPEGVDEDAFRQAVQACRDELPAGGRGGGGGGDGDGGLQALFDCLRDEGVDVPEDTEPGGGGLSGLDPTSPELQEALEKCRSGRGGG